MKFWKIATTSFVLISSVSLNAAPVSGQGTWETTLQGRDLDGNSATFEAYYDTTLNITWLADADYALTTGESSYGGMSWDYANNWATSLNPYGSGITGWRLPITNDVGNDGATFTNYYQGVDYGFNITAHSEMSHMYYVTLGNKAFFDTSGGYPQPGYGLTNTGPFTSIIGYLDYWSATEYAPNTDRAWAFGLISDSGGQGAWIKNNGGLAWAVHSGDIGATVVPIPAAVWLFGSGLLCLTGIAKRKTHS